MRINLVRYSKLEEEGRERTLIFTEQSSLLKRNGIHDDDVPKSKTSESLDSLQDAVELRHNVDADGKVGRIRRDEVGEVVGTDEQGYNGLLGINRNTGVADKFLNLSADIWILYGSVVGSLRGSGELLVITGGPPAQFNN